jgi:hypothetical protein
MQYGGDTITREQLVNVVRDTLEEQPYTLALWENRATGFDRVDEWSDADVKVIVKDGTVEQTFEDLDASRLAES